VRPLGRFNVLEDEALTKPVGASPNHLGKRDHVWWDVGGILNLVKVFR
jgi:hypothetical protein